MLELALGLILFELLHFSLAIFIIFRFCFLVVSDDDAIGGES